MNEGSRLESVLDTPMKAVCYGADLLIQEKARDADSRW